jgi:hypothetical protein
MARMTDVERRFKHKGKAINFQDLEKFLRLFAMEKNLRNLCSFFLYS